MVSNDTERRYRYIAAFCTYHARVVRLLVLLPLALLARRDSRRAGAWCLAWIALSAGLCQGVLAWRAGSVGPLSPLAFLGNFQDKTASWIYHPDNFSPQGLVHKANPQGAGEARGLQRAVLGAGLLLLLMMVNHLLRAHAGGSWEAFAFACLLSPMVSPVAWSHYQVLLAPLLLLLGVRFLRDGAHWTHWAWLLFAYALAALAQQPLGTVPGALRLALTGRPYSYVETTRVLILSSFAQYVLLAVALLWYARGRTDERSI